jgi:stage II sporulation protein R
MFIKIIKRHKIMDAILMFLLFLGALTGICLTYNSKAAASLSGPIRLHIIANSDDSYDQQLKLMIRDAVVEYLTPKLESSQNLQESEDIIKAELVNLEKIAQNMTEGTGYSAYAEYGIFPFPTKTYGELTLAEGDYKAVRIVLGEGKGHNWWCVLFPPLCLVDEAAETKTASVPVTSGIETQKNIEIRLKISDMFYIQK